MKLNDEQIAQLMANADVFEKHYMIKSLPCSELAMRLVDIPNRVVFYVPKTPGSMYTDNVDTGGMTFAVTSFCRKMKCGAYPTTHNVPEYTHPDGDVTSDVVNAVYARALAAEITDQLKNDVSSLSSKFTRVLWAPYLPPYVPMTTTGRSDLVTRHIPLYRYGLRHLP